MIKNEIEKVLVTVLKSPQDFRRMKAGWYRIPVRTCPRRNFRYLAFYQGSSQGFRPGRIRYFAKVRSYDIRRRSTLIPDELLHPRATSLYFRFHLEKIRCLSHPILNQSPRRINFLCTDMNALRKVTDVSELFKTAPIEPALKDLLFQAGIWAASEFPVNTPFGCYRLDFALFCRKGKINIECDHTSYHGTPEQKKRDQSRDKSLERLGWKVLRFTEKDYAAGRPGILRKINRNIRLMGGPARFRHLAR